MRRFMIILLIALMCASPCTADALFTRSLSSQEISPGEAVTLVYEVTNSLDKVMMDVRVFDAAGSFEDGVRALSPNETVVFVNSVTVYDALVSSAYLRYSAGGESFEQKLEDRAVRAAPIMMDVAVEGDDGAYSVRVKNTGTNAIERLELYDGPGGLLLGGLRLAAGEEETCDVYLTPDRSGAYAVEVRGYDAGGTLRAVRVPCGAARTESDPPRLSLRAECGHEAICREGSVDVRLTLKNDGGKAENVILAGPGGETLRTLRVVGAGSEITFTVGMDIRQDTSLVFTAACGESECASNELLIRIASDGDEPDGSEGRTGTLPVDKIGNTIGIDGMYIRMILIAVAVLVLLRIILGVRDRVHRMRQIRREEEDRYRASIRRRNRRRRDAE